MDPTLVDAFAFHVGDVNAYAQDQDTSRIQQSYYDTQSLYAESGSDVHHSTGFPSMPVTPSIQTSQSTDQYMPGLSAPSAPSVSSASSSAIGSPYSGTASTLQEQWVDTNHGLGLPAAVMGDLFPHDYMGGLDSDLVFCQEKFPEGFVGEFHQLLFDMNSS